MTVHFDDEASQQMQQDGYVPPFKEIVEGLGLGSGELSASKVSIPVGFLKFLLSEIVKNLPFDENYYAHQNPDVKEAAMKGKVSSLRDHFISAGYFEGRRPAPLFVDVDWYLSSYPDLAKAFARGALEDLAVHLNETGYLEGRQGSALQARELRRWQAELKGNV